MSVAITGIFATRLKFKFFHVIQGVPKKTLVSVQRLLEVLKSDLQIKVG